MTKTLKWQLIIMNTYSSDVKGTYNNNTNNFKEGNTLLNVFTFVIWAI